MGTETGNSNFNELVKDLSEQAQKGSPLLLAGMVFWGLAIVTKMALPPNALVWYYVFGIGGVFPLGIMIAKVMKINMLASENPLSAIGGLVGGIQIFFAPIIILIALKQPEWVPFVVGILTGAHFLPYVGIYNSRAFLFQTIATVGIVTIIGFSWMEQAYLLIPLALMIVYAITYGLLRNECKTTEDADKEIPVSLSKKES